MKSWVCIYMIEAKSSPPPVPGALLRCTDRTGHGTGNEDRPELLSSLNRYVHKDARKSQASKLTVLIKALTFAHKSTPAAQHCNAASVRSFNQNQSMPLANVRLTATAERQELAAALWFCAPDITAT